MNPLGMPLDADVGVVTYQLTSRSRDYALAFFHLVPMSSSPYYLAARCLVGIKVCCELTLTAFAVTVLYCLSKISLTYSCGHIKINMRGCSESLLPKHQPMLAQPGISRIFCEAPKTSTAVLGAFNIYKIVLGRIIVWQCS